MGPTINLAIALPGAGQDGSTYLADVQLQDSTLLPSANHSWTLATHHLQVFFRNDNPPSYFAGRQWNNLIIDEPLFWTTDGVLLGKNWETIVFPNHFNNYGSGPLANQVDFVSTTMRGVEIEYAGQVAKMLFDGTGLDHVVMPLAIAWWEWQDGMEIELWEGGAKRHPSTYKARPFFDGTNIKVVVYNINPSTQLLQPFVSNLYREIIVRKIL